MHSVSREWTAHVTPSSSHDAQVWTTHWWQHCSIGQVQQLWAFHASRALLNSLLPAIVFWLTSKNGWKKPTLDCQKVEETWKKCLGFGRQKVEKTWKKIGFEQVFSTVLEKIPFFRPKRGRWLQAFSWFCVTWASSNGLFSIILKWYWNPAKLIL